MKEKRTPYNLYQAKNLENVLENGKVQEPIKESIKKPIKKIALILAGGSGERFWPLSRNAFPKQFLNLYGENSLLRESFLRLRSFLALESIFIVLGKDLFHLVEKEIPELPKENFILEPSRRDTLGAISLACLTIESIHPNASIFICPADHRITNQRAFQETVESAYRISQEYSSLITFGIPPTRPDTTFGYIQLAHPIKKEINQVQFFVEKPSLEKAQDYLRLGSFLWNSGMFLWKIQDFWKELKKVSPQIYQETIQIKTALSMKDKNKEQFEKQFISSFSALTKTSIDYALLEKTKNILCIKGDFGWDDLGSWSSLERHWKQNPSDTLYISPRKNGKSIPKETKEYKNNGTPIQNSKNHANPKQNSDSLLNGKQKPANTLSLDSKNCLIVGSEEGLIATIGVENLIIIKTQDVTLVCHKEREQEIKNLIQELQKKETLRTFL